MLLAVLLLGVVIGLTVVTAHRALFSESHRSDFTVYLAAGQSVRNGTDIYAVHNPRGWFYIYPPPFALICVALTLLPIGGERTLVVRSVAGLDGVGAPSVRENRHLAMLRPMKQRFWLYFLPLALVAPAFVQSVAEGQTSVLLLWLVVRAICWEFDGREVRAALYLAGAILLKVFPVALLIFYLWHCWWRFVA